MRIAELDLVELRALLQFASEWGLIYRDSVCYFSSGTDVRCILCGLHPFNWPQTKLR